MSDELKEAKRLLREILTTGWTFSSLMSETAYCIPIEIKWKIEDFLKKNKKDTSISLGK